MPRIRVKVKWLESSWGVDLPNYQMVPGSWLPIVDLATTANSVLKGVGLDHPALKTLSCLVDVPDQDCDPEAPVPSMEVIRRRYSGHPKWGDKGYNADITPAP